MQKIIIILALFSLFAYNINVQNKIIDAIPFFW